jgi:hypothetical protein
VPDVRGEQLLAVCGLFEAPMLLIVLFQVHFIREKAKIHEPSATRRSSLKSTVMGISNNWYQELG